MPMAVRAPETMTERDMRGSPFADIRGLSSLELGAPHLIPPPAGTIRLQQMLNKVEHVAIAVSDLEAAVEHYESVWGLTVEHRETVSDQGVEEVMFSVGESYLQLLGATAPDTTVGKFLAKRGPGLHHIAYEVPDLEGALAELKGKGVALIDEAPRVGGRGHMVAFVHPKGNHGLLVELIQAPAQS